MLGYNKGQIQAVTAVMLTGLMVGTVSIVYIWGSPALEKSSAEAEFQVIEQRILDLKQEIERVSQGGEGSQAQFELGIDDSQFDVGRIEVNEDDNYIDIIIQTDHARYPPERWTMIEGSNRQNLSISSGDYGIEGEDEPGVLMVRPESSIVVYRLEFRNMFAETEDGARLNQVDFQAAGGRIGDGDTTIAITNLGQAIDRGGEGITVSSGQTLDVNRRQVEIELR